MIEGRAVSQYLRLSLLIRAHLFGKSKLKGDTTAPIRDGFLLFTSFFPLLVVLDRVRLNPGGCLPPGGFSFAPNCGKSADAAREIDFIKEATMAVVKENRIVFGLEDIQRIIIRCSNCCGELASASIPSPLNALTSDTCPLCGITWKPSEHKGEKDDHSNREKDALNILNFAEQLRYFTSAKYRERLKKGDACWELLFGLPGD